MELLLGTVSEGNRFIKYSSNDDSFLSGHELSRAEALLLIHTQCICRIMHHVVMGSLRDGSNTGKAHKNPSKKGRQKRKTMPQPRFEPTSYRRSKRDDC